MRSLRLSILLLAVLAFVVVSIAACGTARRAAPIDDPLELTDERLVEGRQVFLEYCQSCHPGGEAGLGPSLNDKPIPGALLAFQVRHGLGTMPAFDEELITDDELDALIAYLVTLRRHNG